MKRYFSKFTSKYSIKNITSVIVCAMLLVVIVSIAAISSILPSNAQAQDILGDDEHYESISFTGALWGCTKEQLQSNFSEIGYSQATKDGITGMVTVKDLTQDEISSDNFQTMSYLIGLMENNWLGYFQFNDKNQLFRIDMEPTDVFYEDTHENYFKLVKDLLTALNNTYGDFIFTFDGISFNKQNDKNKSFTVDDIIEILKEDGIEEVSVMFENVNIRAMVILAKYVATEEIDENGNSKSTKAVNTYDLYLGLSDTTYDETQSSYLNETDSILTPDKLENAKDGDVLYEGDIDFKNYNSFEELAKDAAIK